MVEVKQKDKETSEGVFRRFVRSVQQSGVLPMARKRRFFNKKKSKRKLHEDAKYRAKMKVEVDKLKRMGIFEEDKMKDLKRKIKE